MVKLGIFVPGKQPQLLQLQGVDFEVLGKTLVGGVLGNVENAVVLLGREQVLAEPDNRGYGYELSVVVPPLQPKPVEPGPVIEESRGRGSNHRSLHLDVDTCEVV